MVSLPISLRLNCLLTRLWKHPARDHLLVLHDTGAPCPTNAPILPQWPGYVRGRRLQAHIFGLSAAVRVAHSIAFRSDAVSLLRSSSSHPRRIGCSTHLHDTIIKDSVSFSHYYRTLFLWSFIPLTILRAYG